MNVLMEFILPAAMLAANAANDLKKREIFLIPTLICLAAGLIWQLGCEKISLYETGLSLSAGLMLLAISFFSREAIGKGDSIQLTALGAMCGPSRTWMTLAAALAGAALCAGILWMKGSGLKELPFIPFLLPAFFLAVAMGGF